MESELHGTGVTLWADKELEPRQAGSGTIQVTAWRERQRLRAEELVAIHDTVKLWNNDDSLELIKNIQPSSTLMLAVEAERTKLNLSGADEKRQVERDTRRADDHTISADTKGDSAQSFLWREALITPRNTCGVSFAQQLGPCKIHQKRRTNPQSSKTLGEDARDEMLHSGRGGETRQRSVWPPRAKYKLVGRAFAARAENESER